MKSDSNFFKALYFFGICSLGANVSCSNQPKLIDKKTIVLSSSSKPVRKVKKEEPKEIKIRKLHSFKQEKELVDLLNKKLHVLGIKLENLELITKTLGEEADKSQLKEIDELLKSVADDILGNFEKIYFINFLNDNIKDYISNYYHYRYLQQGSKDFDVFEKNFQNMMKEMLRVYPSALSYIQASDKKFVPKARPELILGSKMKKEALEAWTKDNDFSLSDEEKNFLLKDKEFTLGNFLIRFNGIKESNVKKILNTMIDFDATKNKKKTLLIYASNDPKAAFATTNDNNRNSLNKLIENSEAPMYFDVQNEDEFWAVADKVAPFAAQRRGKVNLVHVQAHGLTEESSELGEGMNLGDLETVDQEKSDKLRDLENLTDLDADNFSSNFSKFAQILDKKTVFIWDSCSLGIRAKFLKMLKDAFKHAVKQDIVLGNLISFLSTVDHSSIRGLEFEGDLLKNCFFKNQETTQKIIFEK